MTFTLTDTFQSHFKKEINKRPLILIAPVVEVMIWRRVEDGNIDKRTGNIYEKAQIIKTVVEKVDENKNQ